MAVSSMMALWQRRMYQWCAVFIVIFLWAKCVRSLSIQSKRCASTYDCPLHHYCGNISWATQDQLFPNEGICLPKCSYGENKDRPFHSSPCMEFPEIARAPTSFHLKQNLLFEKSSVSSNFLEELRAFRSLYDKSCEKQSDCELPSVQWKKSLQRLGSAFTFKCRAVEQGLSLSCQCPPHRHWNGTACVTEIEFVTSIYRAHDLYNSGSFRNPYLVSFPISGDHERPNFFLRKIFTTPLGLLFVCHVIVLLGYFGYNCRRYRTPTQPMAPGALPTGAWDGQQGMVPRESSGADDQGVSIAPPPPYETLRAAVPQPPKYEDPPAYEEAIKEENRSEGLPETNGAESFSTPNSEMPVEVEKSSRNPSIV